MYLDYLDAWVFVSDAADGARTLVIADDQAGTRPWLTPEEQERAAKEQERAAKEAALARIAALEALLAQRHKT